MSDYHYNAYTIYGCEIDVEKLYRDVTIIEDGHRCRGYRELREMGREPKYCMDCGERTHRVERRCRLPEYEEKDTIGGLPVLHLSTGDDEGLSILAAWHQVVEPEDRGEGDAHRTPTSLFLIAELAEKLRTVLEPLEMWDEKGWGLWTVLEGVRET